MLTSKGRRGGVVAAERAEVKLRLVLAERHLQLVERLGLLAATSLDVLEDVLAGNGSEDKSRNARVGVAKAVIGAYRMCLSKGGLTGAKAEYEDEDSIPGTIFGRFGGGEARERLEAGRGASLGDGREG